MRNTTPDATTESFYLILTDQIFSATITTEQPNGISILSIRQDSTRNIAASKLLIMPGSIKYALLVRLLLENFLLISLKTKMIGNIKVMQCVIFIVLKPLSSTLPNSSFFEYLRRCPRISSWLDHMDIYAGTAATIFPPFLSMRRHSSIILPSFSICSKTSKTVTRSHDPSGNGSTSLLTSLTVLPFFRQYSTANVELSAPRTRPKFSRNSKFPPVPHPTSTIDRSFLKQAAYLLISLVKINLLPTCHQY